MAGKIDPALKDPNQWKKDAFGVGTLMAAGGAGTIAATHILDKGLIGKPVKWKVGALGAGLGAIGDYASLKINDAFNKRIDKK